MATTLELADKLSPSLSRRSSGSDSRRRPSPGRSRGSSGGSDRALWDGSRVDGSPNMLDDGQSTESERVKVTIRVRPPNEAEIEAEDEQAMDIYTDENLIVLHRDNGLLETMEFNFDSVLPPTATQADVYQVAARPVIEDVLNGYNGTIMAYGQTGAGKTYTLSSTKPSQIGIIPRASAEVFAMAKSDHMHNYRVSMSYIQIYMEMIQDLLRPSSSNMQIRESENGVYISGVEEVEVTCVEDCLKLLALGEKNRTVAFTKMNALSSRSHAIAIITVEKTKRGRVSADNGTEGSKPKETSTTGEEKKTPSKEKILVGKLFLVDLAGSERLKKSGSEGLRASEAKSVNLSLTVLGKCINARADPTATHVPFRDSKLTRLLQESLGGNAKTSLVINVAPTMSHISESLSSLLFGSRAMKVKTKAVINEEEEFKILTRTLQDTIDQHDDRVHTLEVVVYSQEEQLSLAKSTLDEQLLLVQQLREEKEELVRQHQAEIEAVHASWNTRLTMLEAAAQHRLEEAKTVYKENFAEASDSVNRQRDMLALELRQALDNVKELSERINSLENEKSQLERELLELKKCQHSDSNGSFEVAVESNVPHRNMTEHEASVNEALERLEGESAALRIQNAFRSHQQRRMKESLNKHFQVVSQEQSKVAELTSKVKEADELLLASGHALVGEALMHLGSALSSFEYRFLTPKAEQLF